MNVRKIVIWTNVVLCIAQAIIVGNNLESEEILWIFLYGIVIQLFLNFIIFTVGALTLKRSPVPARNLMTGAGLSIVIIVLYWLIAVVTVSIIK